MAPRRFPFDPVGLGFPQIPYDRSGGQEATMPGMDLPQPGGSMKKMSFEFADAAQPEAPAAPQVPPGAGVPPTGAQEPPVPPAGMQAQQPPPDQGQQPPMIAGMGQGQPDSSLLSDQDLLQMAMSPEDQMGEQMANVSMDPTNPQSAAMQEQLMMAARRRLGY